MQMYLTFFQCAITNVQPTAKKIGKPQPPRRCGVDHISGRTADPKNCTIGAKQPLYWYQKERNNVAGDTYDPPYYNGYLGWADGAQNDIFVDGSGNPVNGDPSQSKDQPHPPPAPPAQQQGQGQPQKQEQKTDQQKTVAVGTGLKGSTKKKCPAGKRKKQNHRNRRHKVKSRDVVIS
ncbi:hypothetical protein FRB99_004976 [Tulasnella sp. 403]|nr:hypothetical protein FRB99_004976 [Tulasnella sp. 403]